MISINKTPKNYSERFICENTRMVYVDMPYFDFLIQISYNDIIRIEVLSNEESEKGPKLKFKIRMGKWRKNFGSDFILTITDKYLFYGFSYKINEHLEKTLELRTLELSYRPRSKGLVYTERPVFDLERMKILKPVSRLDVSALEKLITDDYNKNDEKIRKYQVA
ncbi:MAG: hypothetical protein AABX77_02050 [Nanoarchaeota archaeon]